ncbi:LYR motif-containing protein 2 [Anopheles ziemanni]|uniref:LYR motif-containing protein 2 n=1 Tax=Anopheles coustani TaxID=139045 RepID=UPI00265A759A|nr:LYR motif-containing protein 2 [Anopheles coustani]XP_058171509.1 LYR motif-containing protein 2 [Anopheles ziemanni]
MSKIPKAALSLKQFMLRQEVLKLYRTIFRTIRQVPDESSRHELREWARSDFRNNMNQTDELAIKMLLQHGNRNLKQLQTSLELSGTGSSTKTDSRS